MHNNDLGAYIYTNAHGCNRMQSNWFFVSRPADGAVIIIARRNKTKRNRPIAVYYNFSLRLYDLSLRTVPLQRVLFMTTTMYATHTHTYITNIRVWFTIPAIPCNYSLFIYTSRVYTKHVCMYPPTGNIAWRLWWFFARVFVWRPATVNLSRLKTRNNRRQYLSRGRWRQRRRPKIQPFLV